MNKGTDKLGYAQATSVGVPQVDDFASNVHRAEDAVSDLSNRIFKLADRLVGPSPSDEVCAVENWPVQSGVLPTVSDQAKRISRMCSDLNYALSRIEAALP